LASTLADGLLSDLRMHGRVAIFALVASLAACATEPEELDYDDRLGTPENPIPKRDAYAVSTRLTPFDPVQVSAAAADLRAFARAPARTLLARASTTSVQDLRDALPSTLDDRLEGWIDAEIDKRRVAGETLRQISTELASYVEVSLNQFTLASALTIAPTGAMHVIGAVNVRPASLDVTVPVGGLKGDTITQRTDAQVGELGALTLGEQRFGLAVGSHAWHGINLASTTMFGADVTSALRAALDCRSLAQAVAARCYGGSCVGHATQLQTICEHGAGALVETLASRVTEFRLVTIGFSTGSARLVDDDRNGEADRIVEGTWQATVDVGTGPRQLPATFEALH